MCDTEPMSENLAKDVGVLAGKSGHDDIVDVSVVEGAFSSGDAVVTHIRTITEATGARLNRIHLACTRFRGFVKL